jgi:uncharacterized membrane protein YjdF
MSLYDVLKQPNKMYLVFSMALRITVLIALVGALLGGKWMVAFTCVMALVLTFLPAIASRNMKIFLPVEFELTVVIFIYLTVFLGEVHNYYTRFWWWDLLLHGCSGIVLGFVGFLILFVLYEEGKVKARPGTIAFFSVCFALAMGTMWEIFEYTMDTMFGFNMQRSGLVDTMSDLIVDLIGALVTSAFGYLYLKGEKSRLFENSIKKFVEKKPDK